MRYLFKRMRLHLTQISIICIFCFMTQLNFAQSRQNVINPKAGKLSSQIQGHINDITTLVVSGEINGTDIHFIRQLPSLDSLYLTEAKLVKGGKKFTLQLPKSQGGNDTQDIMFEMRTDGTLPAGCFSNMKNLKVVVLPKTMNRMEQNIFYGCSNLKAIGIMGETTIETNTFGGLQSLNALELHRPIHVRANGYVATPLFVFRLDLVGNIDLLNSSDWQQVESMFGKAIFPYTIRMITEQNKALWYALYNSWGYEEIPSTVDIIWRNAFSSVKKDEIKKIVMPNSVVKVGYGAFRWCQNLTSVEFSSNLKTIENYAFEGCNLSEINLTAIQIIGQAAFAGNRNLTSCHLGDQIKSISSSAFSQCKSLKSLEIRAMTPATFDGSFNDKSIVISVPSEAYDAYATSNWGKYALAKIGAQDFYDISIETPGTLLSFIGSSNLQNVKHLKLSGTINEQDRKIISEMKNLQTVDLFNTHLIVSEKAKQEQKALYKMLSSLADLATTGAESAYKHKEMTTQQYMQTQMTNKLIKEMYSGEPSENDDYIFPGYFLSGLQYLQSVVLPQGTIGLSSHAFDNCSSLQNVKGIDSIYYVGDAAFNKCTSLKNIDFKAIKSIGNSAFNDCKSLSSITLPEGLINIEAYVFEGCTSLSILSYPSTLKKLESLCGNNGVENIYFKGIDPPAVRVITDEDRLRKVYVPKGCSTAYYTSLGKLNISEKELIL